MASRLVRVGCRLPRLLAFRSAATAAQEQQPAYHNDQLRLTFASPEKVFSLLSVFTE